jgi:hypothetical protein
MMTSEHGLIAHALLAPVQTPALAKVAKTLADAAHIGPLYV